MHVVAGALSNVLHLSRSEWKWSRVGLKEYVCIWMNNSHRHFFDAQKESQRRLLFSCSVLSLQPHGLKHTRHSCPSVSPRVCSNSCPLSWWCHPLILRHPLLLTLSIFSSIRIFSSEAALHIRRPKYSSFSISASKEYSGLILFRIDWFDLLAVQWTLKSFLQYHSLKTSMLRHSAFFMVQLSHLFLTGMDQRSFSLLILASVLSRTAEIEQKELILRAPKIYGWSLVRTL